ncbi:enhancer of yellow 2 transcription factor-like isoform X1 [Nymphalis io]|uniref:enhancer of yellow 2 transcription factor-like isoform X1 n=1 Tax=Inachis io TaxID=171585 RepID=UPI00216794E1|nr:enhancer of yellow 2 transcription factor-like isoform X1 [Nymphalis io]
MWVFYCIQKKKYCQLSICQLQRFKASVVCLTLTVNYATYNENKFKNNFLVIFRGKIVPQNLVQKCSLPKLFKELLRRRLIECGWRDQVRMLCRDVVKENEGSNVTFDMLLTRVTPQARALVPDSVKKELLLKLKTHLLTQKDQ